MNWLWVIFSKLIILSLFLASTAFAGGLEVSRQNNMILFSKDRTVDFTTRQTTSSIKDNNIFSGGSTVVKKLNLMSATFKSDYSDSISYAFEMYEPMSSVLQYPAAVKIKALLRTQALALSGKYQISNSPFAILGGIRQVTIKRSTLNVGVADMVTTPVNELGYMMGASYEMPEIALKVLLTHSPAIDFTLPITLVNTATSTQAEMTTLEFETGIAENTLLYGSIHQSAWGSAQIKLAGTQISSFTDSEKYNIGVGRKFNEKLSGSISYTTEAGSSATGTSLLSPTNGTDTYGLGFKYSADFGDLTFGYALSSFGDKAVTSGGATGNFTNNDATTVGLKLSFKMP
jgi:hypothetical protein